MQPLVAIVILNFNGKNYLERFLPSVIASSYANKKIVLADNASIDDSVAFVRNAFPSIEIILNTQNDGFAGGYNWALQNVLAEYYILLNSDVEVSNNWIEPIISLMESDENIAACQPKLLSYHQPHLFEYAGASGEKLLTEAVSQVSAAGFAISNISLQIIGNRPKIGSRRAEVIAALSKVLGGVPVSVSATTTDGMGLTGAGEGIAAIASALIYAR